MSVSARNPVRERRLWDTFQTIIATATKLGVRVYAYFLGRLLASATTPSLADSIRERTATAASPHPA